MFIKVCNDLETSWEDNKKKNSKTELQDMKGHGFWSKEKIIKITLWQVLCIKEHFYFINVQSQLLNFAL